MRIRFTVAPLLAEIFGLLALFGGALLFLSFASVGPLAGRPFYGLSLAAALAGGMLVLWRPDWRWFVLGALSIAAPRFIALSAGVDSHHLLFPLFFGLSAGLLGRRLLQSVRGDTHPASQDKAEPLNKSRLSSIVSTFAGIEKVLPNPAAAFGLVFLGLCFLRAIIDYYSPHVLLGYPLHDREVAPGVSANHALFLNNLLLLHLSGPLLFALCETIYRRGSAQEDGASAGTFNGLVSGIAAGTLLTLIVIFLQYLGVDRLWIATGRSLESGRLPGLFSDSGASSILLPAGLVALYLWLIDFTRRRFPGRRIALPIGVAFLLIALALGQFQGRGFYVAAAGMLLFPLLLLARLWFSRNRNPGNGDREVARQPNARVLTGSGLAALIVFIALAVGLWRSTPEYNPDARLSARVPAALHEFKQGHFFAAYKEINLPRAMQARGGWWIFREQPLTGSGANSFMVEVRRFEERLPGLEIDNPANLLIGLAGDFGLIGLLYLVLLGGLYLLDLRRRLRAGAGVREIYLLALPLCLAPTFLFGYHIVFAEFTALFLLPLLLPRTSAPAGAKPGESPISAGISPRSRGWHAVLPPALALVLIATYAGAWWAELTFRTPPAHWRTDHGGRPLAAPDQVVKKETGTFFYYNERRNFALPAGTKQVRFELLVENPASAAPDAARGIATPVEFACYGSGDIFPRPIQVSRPLLEASAWRPVAISLPAACRSQPNLEITTGDGQLFALRQAAFANGRLRGQLQQPPL